MTLVGYECNRIHIGPLERGPVRILFDGHTNADIPAKCDENQTGPTHIHILNVFFVNDADVAAYLSNEFGLSATFAQIEVTNQASGPITQRNWTWNPPNQTSSSVTFPDDGNYASYPIVDRIFWQRGSGIGKLDFDYERQAQAITDREGYGAMHPPMLWAEIPGGQFVGEMIYFPSMEGSGTVTLYDDYLCEHPESLA